MRSSARANLLLLLLSSVFSLAIAEAIVRFSFPAEGDKHHWYRVPDPVLGWRLQPGARYLATVCGATVETRHNRAGWRDIERPAVRAHGYRICVLGDSFVEGYSVPMDQTLTRQLEALLAGSEARPTVYNLGVGGFGTLQEYLVYHHVAQTLRPHVVMLGVYLLNDIRNNSRTLELRASPDPAKVASRPFLADGTGEEWRVSRPDFTLAERRYQEDLRQRQSRVHRLLSSSALVRLTGGAVMKRVRSSRSNPDSVAFAMRGVHLCDPSPEFDRAWAVTRRILMRLAAEIRRDGGQLMVFSVPGREEADGRYARDADGWCMQTVPGYDRLRGVLDDLHVEYVDLLPAFRQGCAAGDTLFVADGHWNARGNRLAAELLAYRLRALPPPSRD